MQNHYNKGRFRGHEYGKIPPYLKKLGNRKWRQTAKEINISHSELFFETNVQLPKKRFKSIERIKVKITFLGYNETKTSRYITYKNRKALQDSIKRNNIINVVFQTKE